MQKLAIVVLSDPTSGGDEALGRVFNALAAAHDVDQAGGDVHITFNGAGTRWPAILGETDHPIHALYEAVRHNIAGVSRGCATVFDSTDSIAETGLEFLVDNPVPGTEGLPSMRLLSEQGFSILTF